MRISGKSVRRGFLSLFGTTAILAAAACGKSKAAGGFTPPPANVEVAVVRSEPVRETFNAVGTVEAAERVTITSELDAIVEELPFEEGRYVAKGHLLARLKDSELAAEVRRAAALREQARLSFERFQSLADEKIASSQERDNAKAALDVAEANLNLARARLAKTRITAPFAGVVGRRLVSPGAFLRTGDAITDLARIDEVKIGFAIPEVYLADLRRGARVTVATPAYPGKEFVGIVDVVDPTLDPGTRSVRLIARVKNPRAELRPGMSADVRAVLAERLGALTVPAESVFGEGASNYVFRVNPDSTVTRREVKLGTRQEGRVEVTEGLAAGDRIVRAGHQKLFEGAKIVPVQEVGDARTPSATKPATAGGSGP